MASSIIHIAVASELNKKLKRDRTKLLIGTIAPDISKQIGETKYFSHFLDNDETNVPNIDKFLKKYKKHLNDDFVMGYYIHLYTDYLWFTYFIPEIYDEEKHLIKKLDGTIVNCYGNMISQYIYNDYTNINVDVIDNYNLDLKIFYNEIPKIDNIIEEIPMDKLNIIVNQAGKIIENSKVHKDFVFNMDSINCFIDLSVKLIESEISKLDLKSNQII